ncbi:uncharacterized protein MKK02DRAFT_43876 [Dioszegia hungarica]|uniref:Uncharacterized protein n=1 Tax=Dioszegia hungarica TaxID=4972 RepID=A0AA38H851_9TREE|nr:uncharacterized protein MKK02DRAFT_43876 [Dioszegia hungarica]KAI9635196.1 hypothetical protein MKK02DRAFT_43876 [Dioszegia hungarica]
MPIETSPIPFKQLQLPYTPLFDPTANPEIAPNGSMLGAGSGMGMDMGMGNGMNPLSHGPASVAASAIIGPSPGGVAGPHHAIPALPDAGYTAPTMRAASLAAYAQGRAHPGSLVGGMGGEGSVYAGGSLYGGAEQYPGGGGGGGHHHQGPSQLGTVYSDGCITKMGSADESPTDPPILQVIITTTTTITLRIGTIKATLTTEPPTPHTTPCHVAMHMLSTTARPLRGPVPQTCPVLKAVEATERIRETFTGVLFPPTTKPVLTDTSDTETGTDRQAPLPLVHRGTTTITPPSPPRHCATERRMVAAGQGQVGDRVSD